MKRPIAEWLTLTLHTGMESEHLQHEHELWQILRRKQGYVTHRLYQSLSNPLHCLIYSEWDSSKAVDGARHNLQGTPLMRRLRSLMTGAPQRTVFDIIGPVTSTKGLDLPAEAAAVSVVAHLTGDAVAWRGTEHTVWTTLSAEVGHITHVLLRGTSDRTLVAWLSHWSNEEAARQAVERANTLVPPGAFAGEPLQAFYRPLRS
jgi:heme-degrading monooxygenase HmoA